MSLEADFLRMAQSHIRRNLKLEAFESVQTLVKELTCTRSDAFGVALSVPWRLAICRKRATKRRVE
jgi:hypothetical protein